MDEKYYIVRGNRSGVFFGNIKERDGQEVIMTNVRRIYCWSGATDTCQLAAEGVKNPKNCKFTMAVSEVAVMDAIEAIPCTPNAVKNIKDVSEWKIR